MRFPHPSPEVVARISVRKDRHTRENTSLPVLHDPKNMTTGFYP
jgi:hypothetical protein